MAVFDDLLVNGTSLKTFGQIVSYDGIMADAPLRGENVTIPGVAGQIHVPKVRDAYVFTVPMVLLGGLAVVGEALQDLRDLCDSSTAALTLTRKLTRTSGNVTQTCSADYLGGLEPQMTGMQFGRVAIDFVNLDGGWT